MQTKKPPAFKLLTGSSHPAFAAAVAAHLKVSLAKREIFRFADGEIFVRIQDNVRGVPVFVIQSASAPVNENYMELFLILDALKRASAGEVTLVMPYYGYARQDRKSSPRVPISAKCTADLLTAAGADRLLVMDLHSPQIQGFFNKPVDNLFAGPLLAAAWLQKHKSEGENVTLVSPDAGGMELARSLSKRIKGSSIAMIDKRRTAPNAAKAVHLVGDVKGKTALLADDMIDTAGTLCLAAEKLLQAGAKEVMALATHPVFSGPAVERIASGPLKEVWTADTIPFSKEASKCRKIKPVSVAPLAAEAIRRIFNKQSISALFD